MERTPYNIALLDSFLQAMGEGFAKNAEKFSDYRNDWSHRNFTRKIH